jgi:hypothetical protein
MVDTLTDAQHQELKHAFNMFDSGMKIVDMSVNSNLFLDNYAMHCYRWIRSNIDSGTRQTIRSSQYTNRRSTVAQSNYTDGFQ